MESEVQARGERVRVQRWPIERVDRAQTAGERAGMLKLVARPDGRLVGASIVASSAGELTNELAVAVDQGLDFAALATTIHAYPTYGFGVQQASAEARLAGLTAGWRGWLLRALARWWP